MTELPIRCAVLRPGASPANCCSRWRLIAARPSTWPPDVLPCAVCRELLAHACRILAVEHLSVQRQRTADRFMVVRGRAEAQIGQRRADGRASVDAAVLEQPVRASPGKSIGVMVDVPNRPCPGRIVRARHEHDVGMRLRRLAVERDDGIGAEVQRVAIRIGSVDAVDKTFDVGPPDIGS